MLESVSPQQFHSFLEQNPNLLVLDVRTSFEFREDHLEGALSIPLNFLESELDQVPHDKKILLYCAHGVRSAHAGALLEEYGYKDICHLEGGLSALRSWENLK